MELPFYNQPAFSDRSSAGAAYILAVAGHDFLTPDGCLVPRALGEAGLRQRTALLVGGMLIGNWPEHL